MEQFKHFSHEHLLSLIELKPHHNNENSDKEDEEEDEDDFKVEDEEEVEDEDDFKVEDEDDIGTCEMCKEQIYSFHLCYYWCEDCNYSLHKFCAQLPTTQHNHPLHPGHNLTLSQAYQLHDPDFKFTKTADSEWKCRICSICRSNFYNYHCEICKFTMDIICATMYKQKMDHPSHPHQLQRCFNRMVSECYACGEKHSGIFYHCTTCSWFQIHLNCALLQTKLLIQKSTNGSFNHSHLLTLAYSFPYIELKATFFPNCRICDDDFIQCFWHYRCNKCQYYVHVKCAKSKSDAFTSSILMPAGLGKTYKNFKDDDHPNVIHYPFPDESFNLLMHHSINKGKIDDGMFSHQHPLILFDSQASLLVSLHDPMKRVQLLCDGCVRPITDVPFYKCSQHDCGFVLHEWCTRLPSEIQHPGHPKHTLVLLPKVLEYYMCLFKCEVCWLACNGFAYGCIQCNYYVDVNCGFIHDEIIHESHPNHLLQRFEEASTYHLKVCKACLYLIGKGPGFRCPTCDFYLHIKCALFLPKTIRHKYDKHPLILRYHPAENHSTEYFCDICEVRFDPKKWFYHCSTCDSSIHTACAPLKLQCEQYTSTGYKSAIFRYLNVKFGGTYENRCHVHPLTFAQGIEADGKCELCGKNLQFCLIFKCFPCKFALHFKCFYQCAGLL